MAFNGLLFCTTCGNLLPRASKANFPELTCDLCQTVNTNLWPPTTTTTSLRTSYPSALQRRKRNGFSTLEISQKVADSQQTTNEECPECQRPEVQFRERQLRGADEGTTVFYTCPGCGFKWNLGN